MDDNRDQAITGIVMIELEIEELESREAPQLAFPTGPRYPNSPIHGYPVGPVIGYPSNPIR